MSPPGFTVLPDVAERSVKRVRDYLKEYELEKTRTVDAYMLAVMGFSL